MVIQQANDDLARLLPALDSLRDEAGNLTDELVLCFC
jgi:hypothetical protein